MTDEEGGFLSRWSRRKLEAREKGLQTDPDPDASPASAAAESAAAAGPTSAEPAFDPSTLPPIDSLTADSDFTQFLRKGVPTQMKTAALRKLWLSDPAIVNYKTLADYDWDFNAPGYGALLPTDDVRKLVDMVLRPRSPEPSAAATRIPDADGRDAETPSVAVEDAAPAEAVPIDAVRLSQPGAPEPEIPFALPTQSLEAAADPVPLPKGEATTPPRNPEHDCAEQNRRRRHGGALPA